MLKNLLKTWEILAPDEIRFSSNGNQFLLIKKYDPDWNFNVNELDEDELSILQCYIQRCIQDRVWEWEIFNYPKSKQYMATVFRDFWKKENSAIDALLTAYLTALAAQRPITPGQWQHFKGDTVTVVGEATPIAEINESIGVYQLEEVPEQTVYLSNDGFFSTAYWDYKNRVFYRHDSINWARKTEDFLGLVGIERPEHEGQLRFKTLLHAMVKQSTESIAGQKF